MDHYRSALFASIHCFHCTLPLFIPGKRTVIFIALQQFKLASFSQLHSLRSNQECRNAVPLCYHSAFGALK